MRRWISEMLDDAMLPFLKLISPGYTRRLPAFRPAGDCDISDLGTIAAPEHVALALEPTWRGLKVERYRFASPVDYCDSEDTQVSGRLITKDPSAPWVLIIPGYATGAVRAQDYSVYQELQARAVTERGLNAALIDPPFHLSRTRTGCRSGEGFFSPDLSRTQAAVRQSVADAIALLRWLQNQPAGKIGVWGTSLGGCIAGLVCTRMSDVGAAILMEPLDNPGHPLAVLPGSREIRAMVELGGLAAEEIPGHLSAVAPSSYAPALPREQILFVTPLWDRVVPSHFQDAFWEAWGRPPRITRPAGHVVLAADRQVAGEAADFLAQRLKDPPH